MRYKQRFAAFLLAAALFLTLTGCSGKGTEDTTEEKETMNWAEESGEDIILPPTLDSTARYAEQIADNTLYAAYNGVWTKESSYFKVPEGRITVTANGSAEGVQRYKIAVWKSVTVKRGEGTETATQYVLNSTGYIHTDGKNYSFVVSDLDPEAEYRLTISYDSSVYYLYGMLKVSGVAKAGENA